jgi:hypothetical protein
MLLETRRESFLVWYPRGIPSGWWTDRGADILSFQAGVSRFWLGPTFFPFATASAGITVASPDVGPVESKGYPTASVGGGFEAKLDERWHFRLDGRAEWVGWEADTRSDGFAMATTSETWHAVLRLGIGARW